MTGFASTDDWFRRPMTLCRSTRSAELVSQPRPSGGALIGIALWQDTQRTCAMTGTPLPFEDVPLPLFTPPPGATFTEMRGGGSTDELSTQARIETTLSVEAVARHLVEQLRAAGWTVDGDTVGDGPTSTTSFAAKSRFGARLTGVLTLTRPPGKSAMDAVFRIAKGEPGL